MARTARLLSLVQAFRRRRLPVTARELAEELGVSARTVYRDIGVLAEQGFRISGEAGFGYVLQPGSLLPPMAFTDDELEALILGLRWVSQRGDESLAYAAANVRGKIEAVLHTKRQSGFDAIGLLSGPGNIAPPTSVIREALRKELKLEITYIDGKGIETVRFIWPLALGFFDSAQVLVSWCETRQAFRSFRLDRIRTSRAQGRYSEKRKDLLERWREQEGIARQ